MANLPHEWTFAIGPLGDKLPSGIGAILITFTIFFVLRQERDPAMSTALTPDAMNTTPA